VLIPRPDSELIIEQVLKIYSKDDSITSSRYWNWIWMYSFIILKERSNFYGTGIDISKKSINVSKFNAKQLNLTNRVKFFHSSVDNFNNGKYDILFQTLHILNS